MKKKLRQLAKRIYAALPAKPVLARLVRAVGTPAVYRHLKFKGLYTLALPGGRSVRLWNHPTAFAENELFWRGIERGFEPVSLHYWQLLAADAQVILDVGANAGVYALLAQEANPKAKVIAFEPLLANLHWLRRNIAANQLNIRMAALAVSDANGEASFYAAAEGVDYVASLVGHRHGSDGQTVAQHLVLTTRLDSYLQQHSLAQVHLIKIDVEGHEVAVLVGLGHYLAASKPSLLLEVLNAEVAQGVQVLLAPLGYRFYLIDELRPPQLQAAITENAHHNYLCVQPQVATALHLPLA